MSHCGPDRPGASLQLIVQMRGAPMFNFKTSTLAVALVLGITALAVAPLASAKDGDVRVRGVCSQGSTSKLKLSRENRGIEVEFEVDQNRNGIPWRVTLRRNGKLVASATVRDPRAERLLRAPARRLGVGNHRRRRHEGLRRALHRPRHDLIAGAAPAWWTVVLTLPRPFIRRGYNRRSASCYTARTDASAVTAVRARLAQTGWPRRSSSVARRRGPRRGRLRRRSGRGVPPRAAAPPRRSQG